MAKKQVEDTSEIRKVADFHARQLEAASRMSQIFEELELAIKPQITADGPILKFVDKKKYDGEEGKK